MSMGLEIGGVALSVVGWVGTILCCALPMWRVTAFIGNNIVTAQNVWEGVYDSMLVLPQDLQAARALVVIAIVLAMLGLMVALIGVQCTRCVEDGTTKAKITIVSGVTFLLAGIMTLIPVCWSANTIIRNFYNPSMLESQKRELGASLYVGWAAAALQLFGGALLCCSCPRAGRGGRVTKGEEVFVLNDPLLFPTSQEFSLRHGWEHPTPPTRPVLSARDRVEGRHTVQSRVGRGQREQREQRRAMGSMPCP
uniref:Claudin n=1 Tax=Chrysemys picta bellii TaxID=8478 RepID=A0A8C3F0X4_CHRPI